MHYMYPSRVPALCCRKHFAVMVLALRVNGHDPSGTGHLQAVDRGAADGRCQFLKLSIIAWTGGTARHRLTPNAVFAKRETRVAGVADDG